MAQQTAVEWLVNKIYMVIPNEERNFLEGLKEQAEAIEIEHLEDCWIAAEQSKDSQTFFNYYNETYNK